MKKINLLFASLFFAFIASAQVTSTFDTLTLGTNTYWTGSNLSGGFNDGNAYFENQYDTSFGGYWAGGFVYSNATDTTGAYLNPATAMPQSGFGGSKNYAVAYDEGYGNVKIRLTGNAVGRTVGGFYVTNTSYAYYSMLRGDNDEHAFDTLTKDFFLLQITGWKGGNPINDTVNFYLADYRDTDGASQYIVSDWQWVSLLELGNVDSLVFSLSSSQYDSLGYLTPSYFAMDNFVTTDLSTQYITLKYDQDTLVNVLNGVVDTTGGPFTVHFVSNTIPGASVAIDSANLIFYVPQQGVVGADTVIYVICNSSNVCDSAVIVFNVESPSGITEVNTLQAKVYPNPFSNSFSVYHTSDVKTIHLYDMDGRLLREIPCTTGELITGIKADNLSSGIYIVKVISDNAVGVTKITKQ